MLCAVAYCCRADCHSAPDSLAAALARRHACPFGLHSGRRTLDPLHRADSWPAAGDAAVAAAGQRRPLRQRYRQRTAIPPAERRRQWGRAQTWTVCCGTPAAAAVVAAGSSSVAAAASGWGTWANDCWRC